MKRLIASVILAACLAATVAQAADFVTYESITVAAVSIGLSSSTYAPTTVTAQQMTACQFRLETAEIRYRYDGVAPTASEGILLEPGEILSIASTADAAAVRFIRTGGTSGTLKGGCWR